MPDPEFFLAGYSELEINANRIELIIVDSRYLTRMMIVDLRNCGEVDPVKLMTKSESQTGQDLSDFISQNVRINNTDAEKSGPWAFVLVDEFGFFNLSPVWKQIEKIFAKRVGGSKLSEAFGELLGEEETGHLRGLIRGDPEVVAWTIWENENIVRQ